MKNSIIIGSRHHNNKNDPAVLARSLEGTRLIYWEDIEFHIKTGSVNLTVRDEVFLTSDVQLVIAVGWYKNGSQSYYRDVAYALALVLDKKRIPYWNSEMGHQRSTTKLSMMVMLALDDIAVPETWFSMTSEALLKQPQPYIAKGIATSRGAYNFLVSDEVSLRHAGSAGIPLLLQEYLVNDHDLRVICFDGRPQLVLKRSRAKDAKTHLNNTSQGGRAEWLELEKVPKNILTFCEKISKISNREMAGIDLIPDSASSIGYSCLEVNAVPQLTSGSDVDKKMTALQKALIQEWNKL